MPCRKVQVLKTDTPAVKTRACHKEEHRDDVLCIGRSGQFHPVPYCGQFGECPDCQVIRGACLDNKYRQHKGQEKQDPEFPHR